jgi:glycosyltransferase involved in cell wall biosynthesis
MRTSRLFSRPALFSAEESPELTSLIEQLTERQRALLVGALNFHALDNPGVELKVFVYVAKRGAPSSLTDVGTRRRPTLHRPSWLGEFSMVSEVPGTTHQHYRHERDQYVPDEETHERHIVLDAELNQDGEASIRGHGLYWGARMAVERRFPFAYDRVRQRLIRGRERALFEERIPRATHNPTVEPLGSTASGDRAVLFGLHWLDLGGAERWAVRAIEVARSRGLVPIVITDVPSAHPWITRPELSDAIVIPLTHPIGQPEYSEPVLDAIVRNWDVRGAYVHHCRWLYDRLPWLRRRIPALRVMDTHHILEYNGGGYPAQGVILDENIDVHHVISPQLQEWLRDVQGVPADKIVLAPLVGLTADERHPVAIKPRAGNDVFRIGFIGRFVHQKRPYLFLKLVEELRRRLPVHAVIQGGGALEPFVQREIIRHKLQDVVTLRDERAPVDETLTMIDSLVISSQNEGLTLTALEAVMAGVPVVSAEVGSQKTVVAAEALLPREPHEFVSAATQVISRMARSETFREQVWTQEAALVEDFSQLESADRWLVREMTEWSK